MLNRTSSYSRPKVVIANYVLLCIVTNRKSNKIVKHSIEAVSNLSYGSMMIVTLGCTTDVVFQARLIPLVLVMGKRIW